MKQQRLGILLVDDDDVDTEAIARSAQRYEMLGPLVTANNGLEALEILREQASGLDYPFLILLDLNMPMMDGFEFLHEVRSDPSLSNHIIFVLTTSSSESDKRAAYARNVAGYIVKNDLDEHGDLLFDLLESYRQNNSFPKTSRRNESHQS